MGYALCLFLGTVLGMIVMSLCAISKISALEDESMSLRGRLAAAHRMFDAYGIELNSNNMKGVQNGK